MKIKALYFIVVFTFLNTIIFSHLHATKLLIANTNQDNEYMFQPFITSAKSVGFDLTYHSLSSLMDTDEKNITSTNYKVAFFIIDSPFIKGLKTSPLSQKILTIIDHFIKSPTSIVGLFFSPNLNASLKQNSSIILTKLLEKEINTSLQNNVPSLINQFFKIPIENRSFAYHKSLGGPKLNGTAFPNIDIELSDSMKTALLPFKKQSKTDIQNLLPLSLYFYNLVNKNHILIGSSSLLTFSGIEENFKLCPTDFDLRKTLHNSIHEWLFEIKKIAEQKSTTQGIDAVNIISAEKPPLPQKISSIGSKKPIILSKKLPRKIPWMDFVDVFQDPDKKNEQQQLVEYIFISEADALWIRFNPNEYYSEMGIKKDNKEKFFNSINSFTKLLIAEASIKNIKVPKILVGFEISNNCNNKNNLNYKRKNGLDAYNAYGLSYKNYEGTNNEYGCINPLDKSFWKNEIVKPFESFVINWQKFSNGIELSGVILDLEMYSSQPCGFLSTMGFHESIRSKFEKVSAKNSVNEFTQAILESNNFSNYFSFLEEQAYDLGKNIFEKFNKLIPNCMIGCYTPHIQTNWFYKGLFNGLCTKNNPLLLLTFNTEFASHQEWLAENNIFAHHIGVLMLDKLRNIKDTKWFDDIFNHHNGIWLNRFSRLIQKYPSKYNWEIIEQTPLNEKDKTTILEYLSQK